MGYLGTKPANSPLTSELIPNSLITNAKINDVATTKLTGQVPDANAPSGSVIQVVSTTATTSFSTTSGSFTALGLSVSITPSSASNKIYVIATFPTSTQSSNLSIQNALLRNSTQIIVANGHYAAAAGWLLTDNSLSFLDSPSTTSSTTYSVSCRVSAGAGTISAADPSTITVMEIAA